MMADTLLPPYLHNITEYLQTNESELWDWFNSTKIKKEHADNVRLELLKSTYRIDKESEPELYASAERIASVLNINKSITLYQSQQTQDLNASLAYIPGEPHIIFYGPLLKSLQLKEVEAIIGHELHHFVLWESEQQRYFTSNQILNALANDRQADNSHYESARLFSLYTEIYCDRGAFLATENLETTISAMVKMITGLEKVNAQAYLKQADEIIEVENTGSENITHPENYLRSKALQLLSEKNDEDAIAKLIRGPITLNQIDLLEKKSLLDLTKTIIQILLQYHWIRSDLIMAHARQFFHDVDSFITENNQAISIDRQNTLKKNIQSFGPKLHDYFCYVLLDFSVVDQSLEDAPLSACILLSENLGLHTRFSEISKKELKLTKKKFDSLNKSAQEFLATLTDTDSNNE